MATVADSTALTVEYPVFFLRGNFLFICRDKGLFVGTSRARYTGPEGIVIQQWRKPGARAFDDGADTIRDHWDRPESIVCAADGRRDHIPQTVGGTT